MDLYNSSLFPHRIVSLFENMTVEFVEQENFPNTPVIVEAENMAFIGERVRIVPGMHLYFADLWLLFF